MGQAVLRTEDLTKRYGALTAVDGLSLEIYAGEIFGFLGPNGAGKTTSINMMCGLLEPDSGRVFIQGEPVNGGDPGLRRQVGVCPQQAILWEKLTCLEQLQFVGEMYGMKGRQARMSGERLLGELDLAEKKDKLAGTLSGGMKRRLNLALALVHDPQIVVLDEPEAGLDPQSRVGVREYIHSLARKKTIILTTHNMDEAERLADRVAIIDHGRLLVLDTPGALRRTVGEGDVLELEVVGVPAVQAQGAVEKALPELKAIQTVRHPKEEIASLPSGARNDRITMRGQNMVEKIPAILAAIQGAGGRVGEVRLRANTLEDVFIQLTGRRLRE